MSTKPFSYAHRATSSLVSFIGIVFSLVPSGDISLDTGGRQGRRGGKRLDRFPWCRAERSLDPRRYRGRSRGEPSTEVRGIPSRTGRGAAGDQGERRGARSPAILLPLLILGALRGVPAEGVTEKMGRAFCRRSFGGRGRPPPPKSLGWKGKGETDVWPLRSEK